MKTICSLSFIFIAIFHLSTCAPQEDLVVNLSGQPQEPPNFKHYSGYLDAIGDIHLHYWFVESQSNPETDPVVLWLNGGPGCSSLFGLLGEHGPFRVNIDQETLFYNNYSWNKVANVLYLESPAGVGYSYSDSGDLDTSDNKTADENYAALKSFFTKFPEYSQSSFFITGESYGGIYVPTLAVLVLQDKTINFKGFAIGNGAHSDAIDDATSLINEGLHALFSARSQLLNCIQTTLKNSTSTFYHDVVTYAMDQQQISHIFINASRPAHLPKEGGEIIKCKFFDSPSDNCSNAVDEAFKSLETAEYNPYYIYDECPETSSSTFIVSRLHYRYRKGLHKAKPTRSSKRNNKPNDCHEMESATTWLNSDVVREALHIPKSLAPWQDCSGLPYERQYETTADLYKILLPHVRGVLYNGDADTVCNYLQGQYFAESLGLKVLSDYKAWKYGDYSAGFVREYENLTFVTFLNAGHMVPIYQPGPALEFFKHFINNEPF